MSNSKALKTELIEDHFDVLGRVRHRRRDLHVVPAEGDSITRYRFVAPDYEVDAETGCWNWLKAVMECRGGYPSGRPHRKYWEAANGPIPVGHDVHHTCKNPRCVNPDHLEAIADRDHDIHHFLDEKGRTIDQVREIRRLGRVPGASARVIGQQFGVSWRTVYNYWEGKRWTDLLGEDGPVVPHALCAKPGCGAVFVAVPRNKRYCSQECQKTRPRSSRSHLEGSSHDTREDGVS